jgi:Helicase associated domain
MAPRRTRSWDEWLAEYKHNNENGLAHSKSLRTWVSTQRRVQATLSDECKGKLKNIGFAWNGVYDFEAWNYNFTLLEKHHLEQGTCRGPYQDQQFRKWVKNQRFKLKNKESLNVIQKERWARLNALGFWGATEQQRKFPRSTERGSDTAPRASRTTVTSWDQRLAEYKDKKENDLPMTALRDWVYRQRTANANGTLSDERKKKLTSIGFEWSARAPHDHDAWNRNFTLLEKLHLENGCCRGPYGDNQFGRWVRNQRSLLKNKTILDEICQERWARLNTLGFWDEQAGRHESDLVPTAHAAACARPASDGECETGRSQQRSGIVRVTVSVIARFAQWSDSPDGRSTPNCALNAACIS